MSERVLVDTDVVSFLFKGHSFAESYAPLLSGRTLLVSFMTVAELQLWAIQARWGDARKWSLQSYMKSFAVLPYNASLCRIWAEVMASTRAQGRPIQTADAWIAATALLFDLPLVTHNRSDFLAVRGLRLASPLPAQ